MHPFDLVDKFFVAIDWWWPTNERKIEKGDVLYILDVVETHPTKDFIYIVWLFDDGKIMFDGWTNRDELGWTEWADQTIKCLT